MRRFTGLCLALALGAVSGAAIGQESPARDAGGYAAPTAALERGRAVYVLNHCHFCHGVDLTRANMGAANLSQSPLVGADTTAMPSALLSGPACPICRRRCRATGT
jgi:mono/diheme cytochrome c family protein